MTKKANNSNCSGFDLSSLITTRGFTLGIATIMVIFYHTYINFKVAFPNHPLISTALYTLKSHCNTGVDIFLFLSGVGLYYSMSNNPSLKKFYKKRAIRILPAVFIISFIWFAFNDSYSIKDYLGNVFFISFFTEGIRTFWYFALIIILYAIYPLVHKLYSSTKFIGAVVSVVIVIVLNFLIMKTSPELYSRIEIALARIPVFLSGAFAGKYVKEGKIISWAWVALSALVIISIYALFYISPAIKDGFFYRYIGSIFAICLIFIFSAVFSKWKIKAIGTFLIWIGSYSMEIYLIYERVAILLECSISTHDSSKTVLYIAVFFITVILAIALKAICRNLEKNLFCRNENIKESN